MRRLKTFMGLFIAIGLTFAPVLPVYAADTTPPELKELMITPDEVDVSILPATVTVTAHFSDEVGVKNLQFCVSEPDSIYAQNCYNSLSVESFDCAPYYYAPQSETICTLVFPVDAHSNEGDWLVSISATDTVDNYRHWSSADLEAAGFPGSFHVESDN
jgi:hypothetical protein